MKNNILDLNNIKTWRENPELILNMSRIQSLKYGNNFEDKEDLQMYIAEVLLKSLEKFDSKHRKKLKNYLWSAGYWATLDYGRKYGRLSKYTSKYRKNKIDIREIEYHEIDFDDLGESRGMELLDSLRLKAAHWDRHESFDFIQTLKKEKLFVRKIIFYFYFLDWHLSEIAEELNKSESWISKKIRKFEENFHAENLASVNLKSSSLFLEDLPMEKLEDFYELIQKQSSLTRNLSLEN